MIIVSQDKRRIVNFDNIVEIMTTYDTDTLMWCLRYLNVDGIYAIIGNYATEERAKEVLKEIIEAIKGKSKITMTQEELITEASDGFYEMPED